MERSIERLERMKGLRKVRNGRPEVERETDAKRAETAGKYVVDCWEAAGKAVMERSREGLERMKGLRKVRNGRPEDDRATDAKRAETAGKYVVDCWEATGRRGWSGIERGWNE